MLATKKNEAVKNVSRGESLGCWFLGCRATPFRQALGLTPSWLPHMDRAWEGLPDNITHWKECQRRVQASDLLLVSVPPISYPSSLVTRRLLLTKSAKGIKQFSEREPCPPVVDSISVGHAECVDQVTVKHRVAILSLTASKEGPHAGFLCWTEHSLLSSGS